MSILLFEGTDNCGKTEIALEFVKRHPEYQYFKLKKERDIVEQTDPVVLQKAHELELRFFIEFAKSVNFNVVIDRHYPSEWVYGSLFRKVDEMLLQRCDEEFANLNTKIVILQKNDDALEDELWNKKQLIAIKKKYQDFAKMTQCDKLLLNTDSENLEWELAEIDKFLNDRRI